MNSVQVQAHVRNVRKDVSAILKRAVERAVARMTVGKATEDKVNAESGMS